MSDFYFPIQFLGEYIDVQISDGHLRTREVYDFFFLAPSERVRFICLSPHNLLNDGSLLVDCVSTPGAGTEDDKKFYVSKLGSRCSFNATGGGKFSVSVNIVNAGIPERTGTANYIAKILEVTPRIPVRLAADEPAKRFMEGSGTLFEVNVTDLTPNEMYSIRLIVSPRILLNLPSRKAVPPVTDDEPVSEWVQHASVMDPRTCRTNFEAEVNVVAEEPETCDFAAHILTVLKTDAIFTLPIEHHRIVVVLPPQCVVDEESPLGRCMSQGTQVIGEGATDPVMMVEWLAGRSPFPHDDLESSTLQVWSYLNEWAHDEPKTMEQITTAITGDHKNVSLIVKGLQRKGVVKTASRSAGDFLAVSVDAKKARSAIFDVSRDPELISAFEWRGYECRYSLSYRYLDAADRAKLDEKRRRQDEAFTNSEKALRWAIASAIIAIVGTLISILISILISVFS